VLRAFASDRFGDSSVVENVAVKDMIWTFPGTSKISGEAHGIEEILARAHTIALEIKDYKTVFPEWGVTAVWPFSNERRD
jgi:hypothetical protein